MSVKSKWSWLTLIVLLCFSKSEAQLVTTLQIPVNGVMQKGQLWNMLLVNTGNTTLHIQIELSLYNTTATQKLMSAVTRVLDIEKGVKQLQYSDVSPVNYNFFSGTDIDKNPYGLLPVGYYKACFTFSQIIGDMVSPLSEECLELEVAPLSPPFLILPEDTAKLQTTFPQFTWTSPMPEMLFRHLSYSLKIVELLPGQGYTQAIEQNLPLLHERNLKQSFFSYPASAKGLEKDKKYLWQVTANDDDYSIKTDVWMFQLLSDSKINKQQTLQHIVLERGIGPAQFISNGLLRFKYVNEGVDSLLGYKIRSVDHNAETKLKGRLSVKRGENYIDLNIDEKMSLQDGVTYVFELIDAEGKSWFLPFIFFVSSHQTVN